MFEFCLTMSLTSQDDKKHDICGWNHSYLTAAHARDYSKWIFCSTCTKSASKKARLVSLYLFLIISSNQKNVDGSICSSCTQSRA